MISTGQDIVSFFVLPVKSLLLGGKITLLKSVEKIVIIHFHSLESNGGTQCEKGQDNHNCKKL